MSTTSSQKPTVAEIEAFARRIGLAHLSRDEIARMTELAESVAELSRTLPRPPYKDMSPAPTFRP